MAASLNERLASALGRFVEPQLGMSLAEAGAVAGVQEVPGGLEARIVLGFPIVGYEERLRRAIVVPRDLEGVMALAEWVRDLLKRAWLAIRLEE